MNDTRGIRGLAVAALLAIATVANADEMVHPLTLNQAIQLALQHGEVLEISRQSRSAAAATLQSASGAYDPVLAIQGGWSRSTQPSALSLSGPIAPESKTAQGGASLSQLLPTGGTLSLAATGARSTTGSALATLSPSYDTQAGVELRQPLLRDRGMDAARFSVRASRADLDGASASLQRVRSETVAAVERAYWTLAAARLAAEVEAEAVTLAEHQLEETRSRVATGTTPRTELAQPRAELERRRGERLAAGEALSRAENALKLQILNGADDPLWAEDIAPADSAATRIEAPDVAGALNRALAARPELAEAGAAVERRRAETAYARDGIWPALDAVVSYDRYGLAGSQNPFAVGVAPTGLGSDLGSSWSSLRHGSFDATRVALVLGLPVTNRVARGNAAAAQAAEREAQADLARVRKTVRAEVLNAAAALQTAGQRIEAARSAREAAQTQLSAEQDRYGSGLSTNFLVLTRQNDLSRARLDEISALTDYRLAQAELARATGTLIEQRGIHADDSDHHGGNR